MEKLEELGLVEMQQDELQKIQGGAWLADLVQKMLCGCTVHEYVMTPRNYYH